MFNHNKINNKQLLLLRKKEKDKNKWSMLRKYFGKKKLKSIFLVEYLVNGFIIRTLS